MRLIRSGRLADLEAAEQAIPALRRELTKQAETHDGELAQLGRQLADRDDTIRQQNRDLTEVSNALLKATDDLVGEQVLNQNLRLQVDDLEARLADRTPAVSFVKRRTA